MSGGVGKGQRTRHAHMPLRAPPWEAGLEPPLSNALWMPRSARKWQWPGGEGEADLGPETSSCSPVPRAGAAEDRLTDVEPEADLVCPLLTGWTAPVSEPGAPPPPPAVLLETPVSQRAREPVPS